MFEALHGSTIKWVGYQRELLYDGNENLCDSNEDLGRESGPSRIFMNWILLSNVNLGILKVFGVGNIFTFYLNSKLKKDLLQHFIIS